ncbi:hypothetical protein SUGI_1128460 [Cryptomeria japonica]|nr:hypothetical protein SUGI_1128460 [Cryptomeria japonica]
MRLWVLFMKSHHLHLLPRHSSESRLMILFDSFFREHACAYPVIGVLSTAILRGRPNDSSPENDNANPSSSIASKPSYRDIVSRASDSIADHAKFVASCGNNGGHREGV